MNHVSGMSLQLAPLTNSHHAMISKNFFWEVVDELAINKAVNAMVDDLHAFFAHLLFLCSFYLSNLCTLSIPIFLQSYGALLKDGIH